MQTLYLHAGMMKTGSTSIQVSLAASPPGRNYRYLWHRANNSSKAMRIAFGSGVPGPHRAPFDEAGFRDEFLAYLDEELRRDVPIGVISAELLSAFYMAPHYTPMRDWLHARGPDVRVVVYVREPASFIESIYQQKLQEAGLPAIRPNVLYPDYRRRFEPMEEAFGRENVMYRSFSPAAFAQGDIVWDFMEAIGLQPAAGFEARRANESLSRRAAAMLHLYHRHLPPGCDLRLQGSDQKRRLLRLLHAIKGPKLRLAAEPLHKVLSERQADIDWMSSRLNRPLPTYQPAEDGEGIRCADELAVADAQVLDWLGTLSGRSVQAGDGPAIAGVLAELSQARGFQARLARTREMFS